MKLQNFFLSALSAQDKDALLPHMSEATLVAGQILVEPERTVDLIHFPSSACISIITLMRDGKAVETATVGRESGAGLLDAISGQPAHSRIFCQVAGGAISIRAADFRARLTQSPALLQLSLLHVRAATLQSEQGVACNVTHDVHGRLARWLLMTQDRVGSTTFPLTQEYMAVMTGVQRSTVSVMAAALKKQGVIDYSRGHVSIVDRPALIAAACECYGVISRQFESLRAQA